MATGVLVATGSGLALLMAATPAFARDPGPVDYVFWGIFFLARPAFFLGGVILVRLGHVEGPDRTLWLWVRLGAGILLSVVFGVLHENMKPWRVNGEASVATGQVVLAGVALLAIWPTLVRWHYALVRLYFALKPHPAAAMVDGAIYGGREIDGNLYEQVLRPLPGNQVALWRMSAPLTPRADTSEAAPESTSALWRGWVT